MCSIEMSIL